MDSLDDSYLPTEYESKNYNVMEIYVESPKESLTQPQFSKQRFLENVDFDDIALEEMLHNAHRVHVYHSQRESLSVGPVVVRVGAKGGDPLESEQDDLLDHTD